MTQVAIAYARSESFDEKSLRQKKPKKASQSKKANQTKGTASASSKGKRNKELGARGEEAAARFLEQRGYVILERNWTCFAGEADIIAIDGETLVFVEVKTRRGIDKGFPSEAVTRAKREKYEMIALAYLQDHFLGELSLRFDVIAIVALKGSRAAIRHHVGAYSAGW